MSSLPNNSGSVMLSPQHSSNNSSSVGVSPITSTSSSPSSSLSPNMFSGNHSPPPPHMNGDKRKSDTFSAADAESAKLKSRSHSSEDLKSMDEKKKRLVIPTPKIIAPNKKSSTEQISIVKTIGAREKSAPYAKKFKLPTNEILLHDYSAALFRQILLHGRLYLFSNYICFESKIFGIKTSEVIPISDIQQIKKKSRFTVGLEILTNNNVKYSFASFVSRDKTYKEILETWKEVTGLGDTHEDASSLSVDDDIDDEILNSEMDQLDGNQNNQNNQLRPTTPTIQIHQGNEQNQLNEIQQKQYEQNNNSNNNNNNNNNNSSEIVLDSKSNNNKNENQNGATISPNTSPVTNIPIDQSQSQSQPQSQPEQSQPQPNSNNGNTENTQSQNNNNSNTNTQTSSLPTIKEVEKSPLDEIYGSVDQFLSKDSAPQSILESHHSDFQELLSDNFNVSVVNFFRALYSDQCNFVHNYHVKRGDMNVNVKPWTFRERFGTIREVEYVAPVNSPIGPDKTKIQETQRYHLTKSKLIVETDTIMLDIPYGDHFRIEAKWEVIETSPETCKLSISLCVRFIKKTWFKSKIETTTVKETKTSFDKWIQLAKVEVQKMLQIKAKAASTATSTTAPATTTPSLNIPQSVPTLGKSLDKTEVSRLKDEERMDSPKPHHTRSRSRQHLISSSGQVNNSPSSNSLLSNIISNQPNNTHSPALSPSTPSLSSPATTSTSNLTQSQQNIQTQQNSVELSNSNNDQLIHSKQQRLKTKLKSGESSSLVSLKTPFGTLSLNGSQVTVLLVSFFLFILYITMFIQIVKLSSKIETMESIFKDLINNNLNNLNNNINNNNLNNINHQLNNNLNTNNLNTQ